MSDLQRDFSGNESEYQGRTISAEAMTEAEAKGEPLYPNLDHAERFLQELLIPGSCVEIRILKAGFSREYIVKEDKYPKTIAGWFESIQEAKLALQASKGVSVFATINPVKPHLMARDQSNKLTKADAVTTDADIICLRNILIDIDSVRPPDVSATHEELCRAIVVRDQILADNPEIRASSLWGMSGNGAFILVRIADLPNDPENNHMVARLLAWLGTNYSTKQVKIDPATKNPSRIMGVIGWAKCKGTSRPDRPHRLSTLDSPEDHQRTPFDLPCWLAGNAPAGGAEGVQVSSSAGPSGGRRAIDGHPGNGRMTVEDRAIAWLAKVEPSISGRKGHDKLLWACTIGPMFDLDQADCLRIIARHYNVAGRCEPPWTGAELQHKVHEKYATESRRGWGLEDNSYGVATAFAHAMFDAGQPGGVGGDVHADGTDGSQGGGLELPDEDPQGGVETAHQLARTMIGQDFAHPDGPTLRFWGEIFYQWDGACYREARPKSLNALVTRSVEAQYHADHVAKLIAAAQRSKGKDDEKPKPPKKRSVTTGVSRDVTQALTDICLLSAKDCPALPSWITPTPPWPANEVLPTRNDLVHLPSFVAGKPATVPPTPLFFSTSCLDYDFEPDASKPEEWLKFLDQVWGTDTQSIALLQEWIGYLLTPDTSQQKILMLIGPPRSGKGTIGRVITALLGPNNVCNPTLSGLATQFGMENLIGKSAAIISDARVSGKTDTAVVVERLLSISGEDSQSIHRKQRSEWNGRLPTRFIAISNEIPKVRDASSALFNRFMFLQMTENFLGREDTGLSERLEPELPGILGWAVAGWARLQKNGRFSAPKSSENLSRSMADSCSPIFAFTRERCIESKDAGDSVKVPVQDLYSEWRTWNLSKGREHVGGDDEFGRQLRAAAPKIERKQRRVDGSVKWCYLGIRLLTEGELAVIAEQAAEDERADED